MLDLYIIVCVCVCIYIYIHVLNTSGWQTLNNGKMYSL